MAEIIYQSHLFGRTLRQPPKDAENVNHRLLVQAGYVDQLMAGVFTYLPLGLRVLRKIETIVRSEMNALGAQELRLPALHPKEPWEKTGRWNDPGSAVMFQFTGHGERTYGLGWTHEEIITPLSKQQIQSYKDLPFAVYQIQEKFRDEPRARSGLLRGREFSMKDLYSFHATEPDLAAYYERVKEAYSRILARCRLEALVTEASGGAFSTFSHEFQVLTPSGEDHIVFCSACHYAQNKEITSLSTGDACPKCGSAIREGRAIEVGNIFQLKTRFTSAFDVTFMDTDGTRKPVLMGCYGLGPSRVLGTIVEMHHDARGIVWPETVAPFQAHVLILPSRQEKGTCVDALARRVEVALTEAVYDVLLDDRFDVSAGEKFADADLLGLPWRIVISDRGAESGQVGIKRRTEHEEQFLPVEQLADHIASSS